MKEVHKCAVCYKKIITKKISSGTIGKGRGVGASHRVSDEGVLMLHRWFCNACYEEIMNEIRINR